MNFKMEFDMKRVPSVVSGFILFIVSAACSVKEERQMCPCRLVLDLSGTDTSVVKVLNMHAMSSDGIVFSDTLRAEDFAELYVRDVPHTRMRISLWGTDKDGGRLLIPYGQECPSLYMCSFDAETYGETFYRQVHLYKNHCRLTVLLKGREEMPYSVTFRGNIDGYELDGMPSAGDFACVAYPGDEMGAQVIIPRQKDSSLLLDVEDRSSSGLKTFAIGEHMAAAGYDWTAENLEDVTVILDYYVTGMTITFKGWDEEYSYDIIL